MYHIKDVKSIGIYPIEQPERGCTDQIEAFSGLFNSWQNEKGTIRNLLEYIHKSLLPCSSFNGIQSA